jgi:hypothetical protein
VRASPDTRLRSRHAPRTSESAHLRRRGYPAAISGTSEIQVKDGLEEAELATSQLHSAPPNPRYFWSVCLSAQPACPAKYAVEERPPASSANPFPPAQNTPPSKSVPQLARPIRHYSAKTSFGGASTGRVLRGRLLSMLQWQQRRQLNSSHNESSSRCRDVPTFLNPDLNPVEFSPHMWLTTNLASGKQGNSNSILSSPDPGPSPASPHGCSELGLFHSLPSLPVTRVAARLVHSSALVRVRRPYPVLVGVEHVSQIVLKIEYHLRAYFED